eukprot:CAMPEP_0170538586 /NCGR_PEP_ID=MMETSP0209-20121228/103411_1 /TAXON_ID=665100 ORGANISM="Litonotus pictus, Strain P1" /NCGR_SAMPLE_ID=MMETSP0209 /ASSEMBLY_ACC=CAM_ASM_000301 /LENGTH=265 /DNA_ID=CAMNT_0010840325 /DNA_START=39 /DNA_END=833 /DNA_ORIENTATION=+
MTKNLNKKEGMKYMRKRSISMQNVLQFKEPNFTILHNQPKKAMKDSLFAENKKTLSSFNSNIIQNQHTYKSKGPNEIQSKQQSKGGLIMTNKNSSFSGPYNNKSKSLSSPRTYRAKQGDSSNKKYKDKDNSLKDSKESPFNNHGKHKSSSSPNEEESNFNSSGNSMEENELDESRRQEKKNKILKKKTLNASNIQIEDKGKVELFIHGKQQPRLLYIIDKVYDSLSDDETNLNFEDYNYLIHPDSDFKRALDLIYFMTILLFTLS